MKTYLFLISFLPTLIFSQEIESFKYDEKGLSPEYTVIEFPEMKQQEIYDKSLKFIKENYKDPDEVIKSTIENEMVRFNGAQGDLFCFSALGMSKCMTGIYTIQLEFKDGKLKFEPVEIYYNTEASQYSSGGREDISLRNGAKFYKNNGKIRGMYKDAIPEVQNLFNAVQLGLKDYISNGKDSDW